jgi:hypothetical protein
VSDVIVSLHPGSAVDVSHSTATNPSRNSASVARSSTSMAMIGSGSLLGLSDSSLAAGHFFRLLGSDQSGCRPSRSSLLRLRRATKASTPTDSRGSIGLLLSSIPGHGGQIRRLDAVAL